MKARRLARAMEELADNPQDQTDSETNFRLNLQHWEVELQHQLSERSSLGTLYSMFTRLTSGKFELPPPMPNSRVSAFYAIGAHDSKSSTLFTPNKNGKYIQLAQQPPGTTGRPLGGGGHATVWKRKSQTTPGTGDIDDLPTGDRKILTRKQKEAIFNTYRDLLEGRGEDDGYGLEDSSRLARHSTFEGTCDEIYNRYRQTTSLTWDHGPKLLWRPKYRVTAFAAACGLRRQKPATAGENETGMIDLIMESKTLDEFKSNLAEAINTNVARSVECAGSNNFSQQ